VRNGPPTYPAKPFNRFDMRRIVRRVERRAGGEFDACQRSQS
jgi:hypothetical protein